MDPVEGSFQLRADSEEDACQKIAEGLDLQGLQILGVVEVPEDEIIENLKVPNIPKEMIN